MVQSSKVIPQVNLRHTSDNQILTVISEIALFEASRIWPGRPIDVIVSVGCGVSSLQHPMTRPAVLHSGVCRTDIEETSSRTHYAVKRWVGIYSFPATIECFWSNKICLLLHKPRTITITITRTIIPHYQLLCIQKFVRFKLSKFDIN